MGQQERDRAAERAHGGITRRDGDIVTLGDGAQWWLNGTPWARAEADAVRVEAETWSHSNSLGHYLSGGLPSGPTVIVTHAPHTHSPVLNYLRSHLHA